MAKAGLCESDVLMPKGLLIVILRDLILKHLDYGNTYIPQNTPGARRPSPL